MNSRMFVLSLAAVAVLCGCGKSSSPTATEVSTLDGTAPPAPQTLSVGNDASGGSALNWSASTAPDVATYQVWAYSPDPDRDNSYVKVWDTNGLTTTYSVDATGESTTRYFRVCAVDVSGNRSALSSAVSVELGPPQRVSDPVDGTPALGHMNP